MAGMSAHYELSDELSELVQKVLKAYDNQFWHIQYSDILCAEEYNKTPKFIAKIRLLDGALNLLSDKKVVIEIARQNWDGLTENQRLVVVYHELCHLSFDYEHNCYKLRDHDIEDFIEIVKPLGLGWASIGNEVPNILENTDIFNGE
jgi:predicted metallopeptidase